ncbi:MAG: hypothetical protein ACI4L9_04635 [Candidatus Coproplasma sp.]
MNIFIITAVSVISALALVVGLFKGYSKLSCWGGTVLGTMLLSRLCSLWIPADNTYSGLITLGVALGIMLLLTFLFTRVRRYIVHAMSDSQKLSHYRQHDEREENEEQILMALDRKDKKAYRKYSKHKFRESKGPWGVVDRVFGGLTMAINAIIIMAVLCSMTYVVVDSLIYVAEGANLAWVESLKGAFSGLIDVPFWTDFGSVYALDLIFITLMCVCLRIGYKGGVLSALGTLLVLGLLGGAGFLSYNLAFNVNPYIDLARKLYEGVFTGVEENLSAIFSAMQMEPIVLAQLIVMLGQFLLLLIPIIIIGVFIPRIIERIKDSKVARVVDGAFGALVLFVIIFGILMFVGGILYQIHDIEALAVFGAYMDKSVFAKCLYSQNFIAELEFVKNIPLRDWLVPTVE